MGLEHPASLLDATTQASSSKLANLLPMILNLVIGWLEWYMDVNATSFSMFYVVHRDFFSFLISAFS